MAWFRRRNRLEGVQIVVVPAASRAVFDATDVQRRALGNLSIPRSLHDLADQLVGDPHAGLHEPVDARDRLTVILDDLVSRGLVARLEGVHDADQLLAATDEVLPLAEPKRELTLTRFRDAWSERLDGSPQFYMTAAGLAFLIGEES